jgi:hypothetical protein
MLRCNDNVITRGSLGSSLKFYRKRLRVKLISRHQGCRPFRMDSYSAAIVTFASVLPVAVWLGRYQIQRVLGYLFSLVFSLGPTLAFVYRISDGTHLFVCECCFQQLSLPDLDVDYLRSCHCTEPDSVMSFCSRCVRTYIENQVTSDQAI